MDRASLPVAAAMAVLAVVLGACQAEESPPPARTTATPELAEIRLGLGALFAGDHPGDQETADGTCFAKELTDRVDPDELRAAGLLDPSYEVVPTLPNLPTAMARAWVDAQFACTDFVDASTRAQVKVTKGRIDPKAYAACLRRELPGDAQRAAVEATLTGSFDAPEVARLSAAQSDCARRTTS